MNRSSSWGSLTGLIASIGMVILLIIAGCSGDSETIRPHPTSTKTVTPPAACSGQGLIAIDPVNNVGYMPIYTLDGSGNGQLAVVDLTVGAASPVLKEISLTGSVQGVGVTYNQNNKTVLALGYDGSEGLTVYEIDTTTEAITGSVALTGITGTSYRGGIIEDTPNNRAFVGGTSELGILDTSTSPPTWEPTSVVSVSPSYFDSFSMNIKTGALFISGDGTNAYVDTTVTPLVADSFNSTFGITDGNSFDPVTNMMLLSQEVGVDDSYAFNFATLNTASSPFTADNVTVPGLGEAPPEGEGPGGMTVINCNTHQGIIGDEFGQNFKLIHLPTKPITGAPDNNGQPGTMTTADANSAYTIAAALIPMGLVEDESTQLGMLGDPNSLTADPAHNFMYALADTDPNYHQWSPGSTRPLFLIRVDLSSPVLGASPTGGVDGHTYWMPTEQAIPLP